MCRHAPGRHAEIHECGTINVNRGLVYKWHTRCLNGRENIVDDDRDGRPKGKVRD